MGENNTPEESKKPVRRFAALVPWAGVAAVLVGLVIAWSSSNAAVWFAYAPLSNAPFSGNGTAGVSPPS